MAETRQLSVRLPDDVFAGLERIRPEGVSLAEVARAVIAKVVLQPELPSLEPAGTRMQRVDLSGAIEPVLEAIASVDGEASRRCWRRRCGRCTIMGIGCGFGSSRRGTRYLGWRRGMTR